VHDDTGHLRAPGVYFITFGAAALPLAFLILPFLVTALTPFRYRADLAVSREALLTVFVSNNAFIVHRFWWNAPGYCPGSTGCSPRKVNRLLNSRCPSCSTSPIPGGC
jgi:hypothetical protein